MSGRQPDAQAVLAAPDDTTADIIGTTVEHRSGVVWIRVELRHLRPAQYLDVTADIRTERTRSRPWQLTALSHRRDQAITLYGPGESRCAAATVDVDYPASTVTMTVPRRCLDDPAWIRTSLSAATMRYDAPPGSRDDGAMWEDDAYRTGLEPATGRQSGPTLRHP